MNIKVEFSAQMKNAIGRATEEFTLYSGATVQALVRQIASREAEPLQNFLLGDNGALGGSILLFLNDEQILWPTPVELKDGDTLTIATPIAGGI